MIEAPVRHAGVQRIPEEIVDPVDSEGVPRDDLAHQLFPRGERSVLPFRGPDRHLSDVVDQDREMFEELFHLR